MKLRSHNFDRVAPETAAGNFMSGQWLLARVLGLLLALVMTNFSATGEETAVFHIGFSAATFGEVNENDAIAAVRIWAQQLAKEREIAADPQPKILHGIAEITAALTNKAVDCLDLTADEYYALRGLVAMEGCVVAVKGRSITEEYVLLVHRASGLERLSDLRGHKLALLHASRASLVPAWTETILAREGLGFTNGFFSQVIYEPKISKVVLPVFFRQADACVVTRSGFETMVELNPQVGQQLQVIASSPPIVPVVFCFRADYTSPVRAKVLAELTQWHKTPAGRQILTLFQTETLEEPPLNCLDTGLELLAEHQRLCGETNKLALRSALATQDPTKATAK